MKKLWEKGETIDPKVEAFTAGNDRMLDLRLAPYDALGSIAHAVMLESVGLLDAGELAALRETLSAIYRRIQNGEFSIEQGVEDVHSQIEIEVTKALGDAGRKIHTGRSRNDQVALDVRLYLRDHIRRTTESVSALFDALLRLSEEHAADLMPGYTHMQVAMPSSFGLWFGAFAESLVDDTVMLRAAFGIVNRNPLGSAAGYGSSLPLDRRLTTELLGLDGMNYNSVYAQMGRGKIERVVSQAMASVAATLGKLAGDICLYMGQDFGFISFPDELTTGSSIMPQKKNPDVFEMIRGTCNRLQAIPNEINLLTANLPVGYHRDLQLLKDILFPAMDDLQECLEMSVYMLRHIRVRKNILEDPKYVDIFSTEAVNREVLDGMPFRDAYRKVAGDIAEGTFERPANTHYTHEGSIGNLCNDAIREMMEDVLSGFPFDRIDKAVAALLEE